MAWLDQFAEYARSLMSERVVDALNARGCSDEQIQAYGIGYLKRTLPPLDYDPEFLSRYHAGTMLDDVYVFPLTNVLGDVKGFQFRPVDRTKFLVGKSRYSDYFVETGEPVIFGLSQAMPHVWASESVTLVEGVFDLFPVQRHHPAIVAPLTARIPESLILTLRRMCKRIVMGYDNDVKGQRATQTIVREYAQDFQFDGIRWAKQPMPSGALSKDPGDLWELWGDSRLGAFIQENVLPLRLMEMTNDG